MRICLISSRFYPQIVGSGISANIIANSLAELGHEVIVLTDGSLKSLHKHENFIFQIWYVDNLEQFSIGSRSFSEPVKQLYEAISKLAPDVVHVCNYLPMLAVSIFRPLISCPVIFSVFNTPVLDTRSIGFFSNPELDLSLARFIHNASAYDKVVVGSRNYLNSIRDLGTPINKIEFNYLGSDILKYIASQTLDEIIFKYFKIHLTSEDRYILLPSRITEQKGILEAIRALKVVREKHPIKLILTGMADPFDKNYAYQVLKLIEVFDLKDHVLTPIAIIDRYALSLLIKHAEVVLVPSYFEGLGLSAIEGQMLGTPVAASKTFGLDEVVTDNVNGLTFTPHDPESIASCLVRLLENKDLCKRLTKNALKSSQKFSISNHALRLEQIYSLAIKEKNYVKS